MKKKLFTTAQDLSRSAVERNDSLSWDLAMYLMMFAEGKRPMCELKNFLLCLLRSDDV